MASIKPLSEAARSSVRSGVVLFDLARVVEELVYNSLDAGATKVSVFIDIRKCYVKVVDDGSGITRDGLVLLGERYATSKFKYLADMDSTCWSFGFRGESLGSISDVSVLEILTKAHGMPNGFRKILKGCKCLCLGIYDDLQDMGTTVVVRDLFYNQPVRRKQMQSSPKKALDSVRKCVLYIALAHSKVMFKVVDIESEDKLLCTQPSSSPLPLLTASFGIETSNTLNELQLSDGVLELSGYVSSPFNFVAVKALQCFYINSRHVYASSIHKLLNQLATRFNCIDLSKENSLNSNGKRSRSQAYPNYILNIRCPRSRYDLSFEPSKTSVEFKNWVPVLEFLESVITQFWSEKIAEGSISGDASAISNKDNSWNINVLIPSQEDMPPEPKIAKITHRMKNRDDSHPRSSSSKSILAQDSRSLNDKSERRVTFQKYHNSPGTEKEKIETVFDNDVADHFASWNFSPEKCRSLGKLEAGNIQWSPVKNIFTYDDDFLDDNQRATQKYDNEEDYSFDSKWTEDFPEVNHTMNARLTPTLFHKCSEYKNGTEKICNGFRKPFLRSCSSRERLLSNESIFTGEEVFDRPGTSFSTKLEHYGPNDIVDAVRFEGTDTNVGIFQGTLWKDVVLNASPSPKFGSYMCIDDRNFSSSESLKSLSFDKNCFIEDYAFPPNITRDTTDFGTDRHFFEFQWDPLASKSFLEKKYWEVDDFSNETEIQRDSRSGTDASAGDFLEKESSYEPIWNDFDKQHFLSPNPISYGSNFNSCSSRTKDVNKIPRGYIPDEIMFPRSSLRVYPFEKDFPVPLHHMPTHSPVKDDFPKEMVINQNYEKNLHYKRRSRRSRSAPPFCKSKRIFGTKNHFSVGSEKQKGETLLEGSTCSGPIEVNTLQQFPGACIMYSKPTPEKDLFDEPSPRHVHDFQKDTRKIQRPVFDNGEVRKAEKSQHSVKLKKVTIEEHMDSRTKWRKDILHVADPDNSHNVQKQWNILDVSSGILHFASDSLVPDINKKCLENTRVLLQVDKKYIPVVASGTLVIIDQHAADERIRLEELRHKVLSGEEKTITYLDTEQELVLPEIGHQLLQNYAEQIQNWGWICNIHAHGLNSFTKNMDLLQRRPSVVTLVAVPCILGVNLSDIDLLEFLQQLADTDGSSRIPSSVLRILNSKACRGAIMFGDSLLPSECSLIVEELKKTSLCFQCAHGRPTTVPLVHLENLHCEIIKLGVHDTDSNEPWHGLSHHSISLKRAAQRLNPASG